MNFNYHLRLLDRRLAVPTAILGAICSACWVFDKTADQLKLVQAQYPLNQQWRLSQTCDDPAWIKMQNSIPWAKSRLKTVIQFILPRFDLIDEQIKIGEPKQFGRLKGYPISLVVGAVTDAELISFLEYIKQELAPLVQIEKFSLHRRGTLDDSILENQKEPLLVEGRINLVWISK